MNFNKIEVKRVIPEHMVSERNAALFEAFGVGPEKPFPEPAVEPFR